MDHNYPPQQQQRHAFLTVFLSVLVLFIGLVALILLTNGLIFNVLLLGGGIVFLGLLHYVLWGRAFSTEVAGEREEEQLRQRAAAIEEEDEWRQPDTRIRR
jgi:membrane protein implicated in regulation of membrane protease activity